MKRRNVLAYLLVGYGAEESRSKKKLLNFAAEFQKAVFPRKVETVFFRPARSSLQQGITSCIKAGAKEIVLRPVRLSPGRLPKEEIPREIQTAKRRFPEVDFHYLTERRMTERRID